MQRVVYVYNAQLPDMLAAVRLVAFIPARYLGCRVLYFGRDMDADAFLDKHRPGLLVLTKAFDDSIVTLAGAAARRGVAIITSLTDYHFSGPIGLRNKMLGELSQALVVQTQPMADEVLRHFGRSCVIIEEPMEYPRLAAQFSPKRPLQLLWYGHAANHDTLLTALPNLAAARLGPITLTVVSNVVPDFLRTTQFPNISIHFSPWTPTIQHLKMLDCDLVFIPSIDSIDKQVKGHNRLLEAINGGRLAIAHPLPQYLELADYCVCGADYGASIRTALAEPAAMLKRINDGQRYADERFSQEVIAEKWRSLFASTIGAF